MPELQKLRAGHAPAVLSFELDSYERLALRRAVVVAPDSAGRAVPDPA